MLPSAALASSWSSLSSSSTRQGGQGAVPRRGGRPIAGPGEW
jgi:hypothetical protein